MGSLPQVLILCVSCLDGKTQIERELPFILPVNYDSGALQRNVFFVIRDLRRNAFIALRLGSRLGSACRVVRVVSTIRDNLLPSTSNRHSPTASERPDRFGTTLLTT